jgi:hypothetical protein
MSVSRDKTNGQPEVRRESHRRRVLAHLEKAVSEGSELRATLSQTGPQIEVPLIGEARRAETLSKERRARVKARARSSKAAQLDLGV